MIILLNILSLLNIVLFFILQILLIRLFGASFEVDAYYLSIGIIQFINANFTGFLTDLYIPVYNDINVKNREESEKFTGALFVLMVILGIFLSLFVFIIAPYIVKLFASGFPVDKIAFSTKLLRILSASILFSSLSSAINSTLNANLFMLRTYSAGLITPIFNLIAFLFFTKTYGIQAIIYSSVFGSMVSFSVLFFYLLRNIGLRISNPFIQPDISSLLKQNISIRAGNLVYFLKDPITTNTLSFFPTGYITLYTYANSIFNVLFTVINSPILQTFYVKISNLISKRANEELRYILSYTIKSNILLFITALMFIVLISKETFSFLFALKITTSQLTVLYNLFLAFIPFYFIMSFEIPLVNFTFAMREGRKVLQISLFFIILYCLFLVAGIRLLGVYIIPVAMSLAQLRSATAYARFVNKNLAVIDSSIIESIVKFAIFVSLLISLNVIFGNYFYYKLLFNLLLISVWFLFTGKDTMYTLQVIIKKGEIK